jgi:hypothetical protein
MSEKPTFEQYAKETTGNAEVAKLETCHSLLGFSSEEFFCFKERVKRFDGTIRLFVHPEYGVFGKVDDKNAKYDAQKYWEGSTATMNKIVQLLQRENEECPPIVFLEEEQWIKALSYIYQNIANKNKQDFYIVPTYQASPFPKITVDGHRVSPLDSFAKLSGILSSAGVKKIIIGGGVLEFDETTSMEYEDETLERLFGPYRKQRLARGGQNMQYQPAKCLGAAMCLLSHHFQVEVSGLAFSEGRKEQRNIESQRNS